MSKSLLPSEGKLRLTNPSSLSSMRATDTRQTNTPNSRMLLSNSSGTIGLADTSRDLKRITSLTRIASPEGCLIVITDLVVLYTHNAPLRGTSVPNNKIGGDIIRLHEIANAIELPISKIVKTMVAAKPPMCMSASSLAGSQEETNLKAPLRSI